MHKSFINYLHPKKNSINVNLIAIQKWLGLDLEFSVGQVKYLHELESLIDEAKHLSQRLQVEIQKSEARFQQANGLREQMAKYIRAAQEIFT